MLWVLLLSLNVAGCGNDDIKDGCEYDWMTCEIIENTNPKDIDVTINASYKKNRSSYINIIYRGGDGKLVLKGLIEENVSKGPFTKPEFDIEPEYEDNWETIDEKIEISKSWVNIKCVDDNIVFTFNNEGGTAEYGSSVTAYIGHVWNMGCKVTIEYNPQY